MHALRLRVEPVKERIAGKVMLLWPVRVAVSSRLARTSAASIRKMLATSAAAPACTYASKNRSRNRPAAHARHIALTGMSSTPVRECWRQCSAGTNGTGTRNR